VNIPEPTYRIGSFPVDFVNSLISENEAMRAVIRELNEKVKLLKDDPGRFYICNVQNHDLKVVYHKVGE
jgi:hypothetical protein